MTDLSKLDAFTRAYLEAALWSSNDESTPQGGEPLDSNYSIDDIAPDTLAVMVADCARFQETYGGLMYAAELATSRYSYSELGGHDFWLTRNGHGAGFWDGDWSEPHATALTDAAHGYGEFNLYVGDDGCIHGN